MKRDEKLTAWVSLKHSGQLIKLSGEPYFNHLAAVATMSAPVAQFGYEVGLCHDLLEKTDTKPQELKQALINFGYSQDEATEIVSMVIELTNIFTKSAFLELKKRGRKEREEQWLIAMSPGAQSVKYADLIYNIRWMLEYNLTHAKKYLLRKRDLLMRMNSGNEFLRNAAMELIENSLLNL